MIGMRRWCALFVLAGCDKLLHLREIEPIDAPGIDAPPFTGPDAPPTTDPAPCFPYDFHDDFSMSPPCKPWGFVNASGGSTVTSGNGQLVIMPPTDNGNNHGGCQSNFGWQFSAFVLHKPVMPSGPEYMFASAAWPDGPRAFLDIEGNGYGYHRQGGSSPDYTGPHTSYADWIRLRIVNGSLVAETSNDGMMWTTFASDPGTVTTDPARLDLIGGTFAVDPNPAPIAFGPVTLCP